MEEAKKRPRPRRSSAKAATEKMKQQRQTPQEKLISKIVTMGFNKEAVELAVYEEGYNESESIVMFLCENPKGYVERKQKKRSKKNEESAEAQTPSKIQPDKSKRENSNKPNLNEKSLYKLLKKYRMKKANDSNIDQNNEEETRMFYILHSTVKAFLK
eukprot:g13967.t1